MVSSMTLQPLLSLIGIFQLLPSILGIYSSTTKTDHYSTKNGYLLIETNNFVLTYNGNGPFDSNNLQVIFKKKVPCNTSDYCCCK